MYKNILLCSLLLPLLACSGGGDDNSTTTNSESTGVFLDSPVVNIGYRTETLSGVTNSLGEYNYIPGESVTFFIGDLVFPSTKASGVVTPLDLADSQDTSNTTVVNIIRLLQTLDKDGNPDNGIEITETAKSNATLVDFSLDTSSFESSVNPLVLNGGQDSGGIALISESDAISHFEQQLTSILKIDGVWKLTGQPANAVGGSDISLLTFLPDGTYYFAESNEINEGDGFEYGSYTYSNGVISATTIIDTNPEIGFSSINDPANLSITLATNTFTFPTDDPRESGDYTFTKQNISSSAISGVWKMDDIIFVFMDDGQYVGHQPTEANGFVGFELGTYTYDGSTLTISTVDNSDGEALLCNQPDSVNCTNKSISVSTTSDSFTLSVPGEGNFTFTSKL
jgi:hypothetical protein